MDKFPVTNNGFAELEAVLIRHKDVYIPNIILSISEACSCGVIS